MRLLTLLMLLLCGAEDVFLPEYLRVATPRGLTQMVGKGEVCHGPIIKTLGHFFYQQAINHLRLFQSRLQILTDRRHFRKHRPAGEKPVSKSTD